MTCPVCFSKETTQFNCSDNLITECKKCGCLFRVQTVNKPNSGEPEIVIKEGEDESVA